MVIVVLSGGLGSQLLQYAAGYTLAKEKKCRLLLDCCWHEQGFGIHKLRIHKLVKFKNEIFIKNIWVSRLLRLWFRFISIITLNIVKYTRIDLEDPAKLVHFPNAKNYFINGCPNNIGYFQKNLIEIISKFKIDKNNEKNKIKIGIHVRRADYVYEGSTLDICTASYYEKGFEEIIKKKKLKLENVQLLIFCEELKWPDENLKIEGVEKKFVIGNDETSINDFKTMANCDHLVISNSTYSWWAAATIDNISNGMIIAPNLWWTGLKTSEINIYPKHWNVVKAKLN